MKILRSLLLLTSVFFISSCEQPSKQQENQKEITRLDTLKTDSIEKSKKEPSLSYNRNINDMARLIAGLAPLEGSTTVSLDTLPAVIQHRKAFDLLFENKEKSQLAALRKFVQEEMKEAHESNKNVYYPFAGADVVTILTIYPNAKNYVMFGLEIEGRIPKVQNVLAKNMQKNLSNLNQSISHLMSISFFMTKHMAGDFIRTDFQGTTPVLMAFIVRMGNELLTAEHIKLTPEGEIVVYDPEKEKIKQTPWDDQVTGIQFKFRKENNPKAPIQTLTYFCLNIADDALQKNPAFIKFLDTFRPCNTYVKAASYLMHNGGFSIVRGKLLEISDLVLEDDSGVPYRFFKNDSWKVTLYGRYNGPIPLFKGHFQKDYFDDYQAKNDSIKNLDFGIGYVYTKGRSNLMKAEKLKPVEFKFPESNKTAQKETTKEKVLEE